tara:strand:+ start:45 stop:221 length:177 start_codon:yes stop_codon:yes gene_type:complete
MTAGEIRFTGGGILVDWTRFEGHLGNVGYTYINSYFLLHKVNLAADVPLSLNIFGRVV